MNILLLTDKVPWSADNGSSIAIIDMIRLLHRGGNNITVLSANTRKHHADPGSVPDSIRGICKTETVEMNTSISFKRLMGNLFFSNEPYNFERFFTKRFEARLKEILASGNFDIVQFEGLALYKYLPAVRRYSGAKAILRAHNVENIIWRGLAAESTNLLFRLYYRVLASRILKLEKEVSNGFDGLVAISNDDMEWFRENGLTSPNLTVIPEYAGYEKIISTDAAVPGSVCFIGSLDWQPNINGLNWFLKKVWPLVLKGNKKARFVIAGRNPAARFTRLTKKYMVEYAGRPDDSSEFISMHSLMVVPLFSGSGIRIKILEATLAGKPVITTNTGASGLPDYLKEALLITDDPHEMASIIIFLTTKPELIDDISSRLSMIIKDNFSKLDQSELMNDFYSSMIDGN